MSEIVDTSEGSFRRVTDGVKKWWLWECPNCKQLQPVDLNKSERWQCYACPHEGKDLGGTLVATMQASIIMGESPSHDEGQAPAPRRDGADGP